MAHFLPPLRLTGADILRDGAMQRRSISLAEGRIVRGPLPEVDLSGFLVLPGIVDLHGTGFERHLCAGLPRALAATDREAVAHGVTTAYLAQGWSWEGGPRAPDQACAMMAALRDYRPRMLADLRLQLRAACHLVDAGSRMIEAVRHHRIGYVVFHDNLARAAEMRDTAPADFALWAHRLGQCPEDMAASLHRAAAQARDVPRHLCALAEAFDDMGVLYGSHQDPDGETRERYSMIGARVVEFPLTRRAAAAGKAMMNSVVMAAPGVLRGAPAGQVAALDLIAEGLCDALASGDDHAALAQAVWAIVDRGLAALPKAWAMISATPAEMLRLPDRGSLNPGRRADLVVIHATTREIQATICAGRLAYLTGEARARFLAQPQALPMAAE